MQLFFPVYLPIQYTSFCSMAYSISSCTSCIVPFILLGVSILSPTARNIEANSAIVVPNVVCDGVS